MPSRNPKQPKSSRHQGHKKSKSDIRHGKVAPITYSTCTSLVLIDGSERREKEWELYQISCQKLEKQTKDLKTFEEHEVEAHQRWLETSFVSELTELRKQHASLAEKSRLIQDVHEYAEGADISLHKSYSILLEAQAKGTIDELWQALEDSLKAKDAAPSEEDEEFEDFWQSFTELFDEDLKDFDQAKEQAQSHSSRSHSGHQGSSQRSDSRMKASRPNQEDGYLKGLYHKLVRLLHPDMNPQQTERKKALFFKVQDAYRWQDIETLEQLYRLVTSSEEGLFSSADASISDIIARRKLVDKRIKDLGKQIREAKQHPAWGFLERRKNSRELARYTKELREEILLQFADLRFQLSEAQRVIDLWEKQSKRSKKPRTPKAKTKLSSSGETSRMSQGPQ